MPRVRINYDRQHNKLSILRYMDSDAARESLDRLSLDTTTNINEDVTVASESSGDSRQKHPESVLSSLRASIDGSSSYINNFNILKHGAGQDDEPASDETTILGPNSIYDLTQALDMARIKSNKALRSQVSVNGNSQTFHNLSKPSTKDIPPIQLQPLKQKVVKELFTKELMNEMDEDYETFESGYNPLTADVLSTFAESYQLNDVPDSCADKSNDEVEALEIPEVFEDPSFRLDNPRIFRQVMQISNSSQNAEILKETEFASNSVAQENLLKYLDSVEVQLISEISKTSDSFFTTLDDVKFIRSRSKACTDTLGKINCKLNSLEESQAKAGSKILDILDESRSVIHFEASLIQLKNILNNLDKAHELFKRNENVACLNLITETESLIRGTKEENISDFQAETPSTQKLLVSYVELPALNTKITALSELKTACSKKYIDEFISFLVENLRIHYRSVRTQDTINRIYAMSDRKRKYGHLATNRSFMEIDDDTKQFLTSFIQNLTISGCLVEAISHYQTTIIKEVKAIIRLGLPTDGHQGSLDRHENIIMDSQASSNNSDLDVSLGNELKCAKGPENHRGTLSGNIKNLSNISFHEMMRTILSHLSECLRRLTFHQKLLLDISLTTLSEKQSQNIDVISLDITSAINKAIEITQVRLVKVLNVRSEQLGDLPLNEYLPVFSLLSSYLSECESINPGYNSSDLGRSLNEWVKNHVSYFLHRFHSNSIKLLASACDKEIWKEYNGVELLESQIVLDNLASLLRFLNNGEGCDGTDWADGMLDIYEHELPDGAKWKADIDSSPREPIVKLGINDNFFFVPFLITQVIKNTEEYVILSRMFGFKAFMIKQNLITYLKVLNSRVSMAILNAGATRTAGLKHITTKHLALCIQTVDFLAIYSAILQGIFQVVKDIAEATQDEIDQPTFAVTVKHFEEHKKELMNKLVSIMHDRTLSHCNAIKEMDTSKSVTHPHQCRPYMETLVKETTTVSKVVEKYLSPGDCSRIMSQIFENYKKLLVNCFCAELPQLKDFNEKHFLLKDIDFFRVKLGDITGYGSSGQVIWESVNSLPTLEDSEMEEKMRHNIEYERFDLSTEEKPKGVIDEFRESHSLQDAGVDAKDSSPPGEHNSEGETNIQQEKL